MPKHIENAIRWYQRLSSPQRLLLQLIVGILLVLFLPSGKKVLGPLLMLFFWIVLSLETRTITLSTIFIAASIGLIGFVPVGMVLETPVVLIFGRGAVATAVINQTLEALLIAGALVAMSMWPGSRLRYSGSILDFTILGLCLGVGLECGIGVIYPQVAGHTGKALGMLPQLPGMLGSALENNACASPATWGMALGLVVGVMRYIFGPDFSEVWHKRAIGIGVLVVLLGWMAMERSGYVSGSTQVWYWLDLKGRLLTYGTGLLAMIAILIEWLLIQEHGKASPLPSPWSSVERAWNTGESFGYSTVYSRIKNILHIFERRGLQRELILAANLRPTLNPSDQAQLDRRVLLVKQLLATEGS